MSNASDRGRSLLQEGLDRNQAEGCSQEYCGYPEQEHVAEMPREQGEGIFFANRPRRQMRFAMDFQDAFVATSEDHP